MKRIFKYALAVEDQQSIVMPSGAEILTVQMQGGEPQVWALVDDTNDKHQRTFLIFGTGHPVIDNPGNYVGTFQLRNGALVFHVFVK